jgi:hypothetical protein
MRKKAIANVILEIPTNVSEIIVIGNNSNDTIAVAGCRGL